MCLFFLDFDGVLFDTVKEAYLLSRYAYKGVSPYEEINDIEYKKFKELRSLVTKSEHLYLVWKILSNELKVQDFLNSINDIHYKDIFLSFNEKYEKSRKNLMNEHFEFWNSLDTPFDFFYKIKEEVKKQKYTFIILSNKETFPIKQHIINYDLDIEIVGIEVLRQYKNKADYIRKYKDLHNVKKIVFVDDSIENLNECKDIEDLICLHAGWGYSSVNGLSQQEVINIMEQL